MRSTGWALAAAKLLASATDATTRATSSAVIRGDAPEEYACELECGVWGVGELIFKGAHA